VSLSSGICYLSSQVTTIPQFVLTYQKIKSEVSRTERLFLQLKWQLFVLHLTLGLPTWHGRLYSKGCVGLSILSATLGAKLEKLYPCDIFQPNDWVSPA
uniref:Uncharacterized protein n=1 Tax=Myripristis murdjan TaxID=586833 RepID=A0A667XN11_9TELE